MTPSAPTIRINPTAANAEPIRLESETEIVFKYRHNDGVENTSRAWWFEEPSNGTRGIRLQRMNPVPYQNRLIAWFVSAMHRENLHSLATVFSDTQLQGGIGKILPLVRLLDPRLEELTLITINNMPVIHARLKGVRRLMPVQLLGEGVNRVLGLPCWYVKRPAGYS